MSAPLDVAKVREQFPALSDGQIYMDNAGGSQVLGSVVKRISDYLTATNVQLGASYSVSAKSTELYNEGYQAAAKFISSAPEDVVIGSSTTQLFRNLSFAFTFSAGDEVVISKIDHETNISAWVDMAKRLDLTVKWWLPNEDLVLTPETLKPLLSARTRLVACTHASNVLGTINDIKALAETVHTVPGAMICVDGVAFAPHRAIDVRDLDVDFYAFSWYKVYGPHISILYGKPASYKDLHSLSHYFNPADTLAGKIGLAGTNYELLNAVPAVVAYFGTNSKELWRQIAAHEQDLAQRLLAFLNARPALIKVHGLREADSRLRVPTISFTVKGWESKKLVQEVERRSATLGFRWGHFYSHRLVTELLGLGEDGVVRVSMVHYNTVAEVEQLIEKLKEVIGE